MFLSSLLSNKIMISSTPLTHISPPLSLCNYRSGLCQHQLGTGRAVLPLSDCLLQQVNLLLSIFPHSQTLFFGPNCE